MKLNHEQLERLRQLEDTEGRISPERLVEDAKGKRSPLHGLFNWDMKHAAYQYWLQQAREILHVKVVIETQQVMVRAPMYVRDPDAGQQQGYVRLTALAQNPANARASLVHTLEVAAGHLRRAYDLAGSLGLQGEIDQLLQDVAGLQRLAGHKAA